jgi:hypothetical protein
MWQWWCDKQNTFCRSFKVALYSPHMKLLANNSFLCHDLCVGGVGVRKHLVSVNYRTNAWVDLLDFSVAYWGVTRGRFLSMISFAAHPRWPLRPPSLIWFPSITGQTPGSIDLIFMWLIGGDYRGRFLSRISSASHPRWPLRPPSWI